MSFQEPVNIMGVMAFPNPDKKKQVIRFIDSSYKELFKVPDGGNVELTRADGSRTSLPCIYIDDYHAKIGNSVYHICQFAEILEKNGATCSPELAHKDVGCQQPARSPKQLARKKERGEAR